MPIYYSVTPRMKDEKFAVGSGQIAVTAN